MQRNNPHLIGICSIAIVSVVAFWGFGLAEKIIPQVTTTQITAPDTNRPTYMTKSTALSSADAELKSPTLSSADAELKNTPKPIYEKKPSMIERTAKPVSQLELLERKEFQLNLSGTYYAGSPSTSKPVALEMKIRPIPGANLENFEIIEAKLTFDNSRVSIKNPSITIKGNSVLMTFTSYASISSVIAGTLDEPILSNKNDKQTLVIQNQLFYLSQKDIPYHIDMTGTLSIS